MSKQSSKKEEAVKKEEAAAGKPVSEGTVSVTNDQKNIALICHLSGFFWFIVPGLNILIPLIVMLVRAKEDTFIGHHSRQAFIFQVIMSLLMALLVGVGVLLMIVLVGFIVLGVALVVAVVDVIYILKATFAASRGERYFYPFMDGI